MLDFIPWVDEIHIVEMGRLILADGAVDTILASKDGVPYIPLYYLGPCLQEILFRTFGPIGVRISPLIGLSATAFFFNRWLNRAYSLRRRTVLLLTLIALTAPLLVQSTRLVRVDNWVFACVFAVLVILGRSGGAPRTTSSLIAAGAIAAASVFIWPTAILPAMLFPVICFSARQKKEFAIFLLSGAATVILLILPVKRQLLDMVSAFGAYADSSHPGTFSPVGLLVPFVKETLRSPFLMALSAFGFGLWTVSRRCAMIAAFLLALLIGIVSNLHTFRFIFLTPFFLVMTADATAWMERRAPRLSLALLTITALYGVITGPLAYLIAPHETISRQTESALLAAVGQGNQRILTPDFATYYIGRQNGWRQFTVNGLGDDGDERIRRKAFDAADVIVLQRHDPFHAVEETHTLYGLIRDCTLNAARKEQGRPDKSLLARIGTHFAGSGYPTIHPPKDFAQATVIGDFSVYRKTTPRRQ